jgi:hypothetical protein
MQHKAFLESIYLWFLKHPVFIQIALVTIVISVALFLLTNAALLLERVTTAYRESRIKRASIIVSAELTENLMMEDVISDLEFTTLINRISELTLNNRLVKQVVIDQIIFYHKNFTDSTEQLLTKLFSQLNLIESAIKKVEKGSWELKAKGLREMQEMMPNRVTKNLIDPLLNHDNPDLRIEAQATFMRLDKSNPFEFLDSATEELLEWHQILLYDIIANTPDLPTPNIHSYLKSKNASVVSFSIKLVVYYQILEELPTLISLLDHDMQKIREEAVVALGSLNVEESEHLLIEKFPMEDLKVQLKILTSLGQIGSGKQLAFLKNQFIKSDEFSIIKTAACALAIYPAFEKNMVLDNVNEISPLHETIINHCTNTLIRN